MKSKRASIMIGSILLVCAIAAVAILSSTDSTATQVSKQLDLGNKFLLDCNYKEAIIAYEKVIEIDPKNIKARMGLADVYIKMGELDKAEARLDEVLAIEPDYTDAIVILAKVLNEQGKSEEAKELLESILAETDTKSETSIKEEDESESNKTDVDSPYQTDISDFDFSDYDYNNYLMPFSSRRLITLDDIREYQPIYIDYIRNEIFARHGYIFSKLEYSRFFESKEWYKKNSNFSDSDLNSIELQNVEFLKKYKEKIMQNIIIEDGRSVTIEVMDCKIK